MNQTKKETLMRGASNVSSSLGVGKWLVPVTAGLLTFVLRRKVAKSSLLKSLTSAALISMAFLKSEDHSAYPSSPTA